MESTTEKMHTESSESKMLRCRMLGWVYEITEVQVVFVLLLNPKWNILALKTELFQVWQHCVWHSSWWQSPLREGSYFWAAGSFAHVKGREAAYRLFSLML